MGVKDVLIPYAAGARRSKERVSRGDSQVGLGLNIMTTRLVTSSRKDWEVDGTKPGSTGWWFWGILDLLLKCTQFVHQFLTSSQRHMPRGARASQVMAFQALDDGTKS